MFLMGSVSAVYWNDIIQKHCTCSNQQTVRIMNVNPYCMLSHRIRRSSRRCRRTSTSGEYILPACRGTWTHPHRTAPLLPTQFMLMLSVMQIDTINTMLRFHHFTPLSHLLSYSTVLRVKLSNRGTMLSFSRKIDTRIFVFILIKNSVCKVVLIVWNHYTRVWV